MPTYIYGLYCPLARTIRYVGKSNNPQTRLRDHICTAKSGKSKQPHCHRWIATLLEKGLEPEIHILATVADDVAWQDVECAFIALGPTKGWKLTNATDGGEGMVGLSAESMARRVAAWKKTFSDPLMRARMSQSVKEAWAKPGVRERYRKAVKQSWIVHREAYIAGMRAPDATARRSRASKRRWKDPNYAALIAELVKTAYSTEEARAAQSERSKLAHKDLEIETRRIASLKATAQMPQTQKRMRSAAKEINARPEVRVAKAEASKADWADPEKHAERVAALNAPAAKAKHIAARRASCAKAEVIEKYEKAAKERWQGEKGEAQRAARKAMWADPVRRAEMIAKQKAVWARRKQAKT